MAQESTEAPDQTTNRAVVISDQRAAAARTGSRRAAEAMIAGEDLAILN
jgi:hypothetical protein